MSRSSPGHWMTFRVACVWHITDSFKPIISKEKKIWDNASSACLWQSEYVSFVIWEGRGSTWSNPPLTNKFIITLTFTISTFLLFKIHLHNYRKCWSNWVKCHSNQNILFELQLSCWILFPIEVCPQAFILGAGKISLFPLIFKAHLTNKLPICLLWIYGWQTANLKAVCLTSKLFAQRNMLKHTYI